MDNAPALQEKRRRTSEAATAALAAAQRGIAAEDLTHFNVSAAPRVIGATNQNNKFGLANPMQVIFSQLSSLGRAG
jgi:hypothetical protein